MPAAGPDLHRLPESSPEARLELKREFLRVRTQTAALARPLHPEDMVVQTMEDVSPTKWHLAHTTWFFEAFVLREAQAGYRVHHSAYHGLFNSYYRTVGDPHPRPRRGLLSRPTVAEVLEYRRAVDAAMEDFLEKAPDAAFLGRAPVVTLGLQHEQQHQELLLMDVQHVLATQPLQPSYVDGEARADSPARTEPGPTRWQRFEGGTVEVGHDGEGFAFDNESPRHRVLLEDYELAEGLVSCGQYRDFVEDGGYRRPELWLADGWDLAQRKGWEAPLYWTKGEEGWRTGGLRGPRPLDPARPVCHLSHFEADAFARWSGARLPTEFEWEHAARGLDVEGAFLESGDFEPRPESGDLGSGGTGSKGRGLRQMYGTVWQWTSSAYLPYPRYRPFEGSLGEYNGKFMSGQVVLRGGCCATPRNHARATYRNFYYPHQRWMFSGLRLARSVGSS